MTNVGEAMEKRQPLSTVGGNVFGEATMENSKKVLQKIKNRAIIWSSNASSGYLSKEKKNIIWKDIHTPMFVTALFTTAKIWKQRKDPDAGKGWGQEEKGMREDEMVVWHHQLNGHVQFSSVQSLSHVRLFATIWTTAHQASLSITNSRSTPKPMSIESVILSNHLILRHPLLLLSSIFSSIKVFSNESALLIR